MKRTPLPVATTGLHATAVVVVVVVGLVLLTSSTLAFRPPIRNRGSHRIFDKTPLSLDRRISSFLFFDYSRRSVVVGGRERGRVARPKLLFFETTTTTTTTQLASTPTERDLELFQSFGEASRKFRRSYFSHSDWYKARADDRFLNNISSLAKSAIVRQLAKEVSIVASISTLIVLWNILLVAGYDDLAGVHHDSVFGGMRPGLVVFPLLTLPSEPFTYSSPSLGLLLVFRTNTAYKRWDEGRKAWGAIINSCRTCVRLGTTWAEAEPDGSKQNLELLADAVWSFPRSLQYHLLGPLEDGAAYARDLQQLQDQDYAADLLRVRHKPTRALKQITQVLATINFHNIMYQVETEKAVTSLCDSLGACERIFTSPPPVFYSRHTARFLVVWVFLLPFSLWTPFAATWNHLAMIPVTVVISYFLLGIDELSAQMEEPFSILPMEKMGGGIRLSADEHVDWKEFILQEQQQEKEEEETLGYYNAKPGAVAGYYGTNDYPSPDSNRYVPFGTAALTSYSTAMPTDNNAYYVNTQPTIYVDPPIAVSNPTSNSAGMDEAPPYNAWEYDTTGQGQYVTTTEATLYVEPPPSTAFNPAASSDRLKERPPPYNYLEYSTMRQRQVDPTFYGDPPPPQPSASNPIPSDSTDENPPPYSYLEYSKMRQGQYVDTAPTVYIEPPSLTASSPTGPDSTDEKPPYNFWDYCKMGQGQ
jgi:ion channel-forming bestrophin family protein